MAKLGAHRAATSEFTARSAHDLSKQSDAPIRDPMAEREEQRPRPISSHAGTEAHRADLMARASSDLGLDLIGAHEIDQVVDALGAFVRQALGARWVAITMPLEDHTDAVTYISTSGGSRTTQRHAQAPTGVTSRAIEQDKLFVCTRLSDHDAPDELSHDPQLPLQPEDRYVMVAPLSTNEGALGALTAAWNEPVSWSDAERHSLTQATKMCAAALRRMRHQDTERRARSDLEARYQNALEGQRTLQTDQRRLEQHLLDATRMESLGRLAGGVAHDFNNLLTAILTSARFLGDRLPPDDPYHDDVVTILEASERASDLTKQLLTFARRQVVEPRRIHLNAIIHGLSKLLRRLIPEDIDIVFAPGRDVGTAWADVSQIEQVIVNIAINARDAMPIGGRLSIETDNAYLDESYSTRPFELRSGNYVVLSITDTGHGMDQETLGRVFEPFFTTKTSGKGTGLGLATSYGIVKRAGGHISVESELGRGSVFRIYLPWADKHAVEPSAILPSPASRPMGSETILIVEDEALVRRTTERILQALGYQLLVAASVEEALMVARAHAHPIHLLLTDVVMPGMSGRRLAEILLAERPSMRVLYISGYTGHSVAHHGILDQGAHLLTKPFTPESLGNRVRELLGRR